MKQRTELEWRALHEKAIFSILQGLSSSDLYSDWSWGSIVNDALSGADRLVEELRNKEKNNQSQSKQ